MSSLGPAWMNVTFDAGCVYRTSVRSLFIRLSEEGDFRLENGAIVFIRASGSETRWPYRLEGGRLLMQEGANETFAYVRAHSPASHLQSR